MVYRLFVALLIVILGVGLAAAQDETYRGSLDANNEEDQYEFILKKGESVLITAEAVSGDLDTVITLYGPDGAMLAENDDRNGDTLDSALGFTAVDTGSYTLTIARYDGQNTSGNYELQITIGGEDILEPLIALTSIELSGPGLTIDTPNFRIHYTLEGIDRTTEAFAQEVAKTMEEVWRIQIEQMGWPAPVPDGMNGGDGRLDVYLVDMLEEEGEGALGMATPGDLYGDNPATEMVERYAASATLQLDNDFVEIESKEQTAVELMRATAAHEFHHAVQFGYDANDPYSWYFESTAVWMEIATFPKDQDAVGYVDNNYDYPEICFGATDEPSDGLLQYGEWMFIQSLVDAYGRKVVHELWENVARHDGFEALEETLAAYGDTVEAALARYRLQNVVRDYKFATYFDEETLLWLEDRIVGGGRWVPSDGAQELGANYFAFVPGDGTFNVTISGDDNRLRLWGIGVRGEEADTFDLGRGGNLSADGYDHMYVMVFNPEYDNNLNDCAYVDYALRVTAANGALARVSSTLNARYFLPLK
ncbi:MAG: PPC domain-containing protein [Anaerolineae bacterium]|nr:PPC domain-containing protein [Anaerolineae bacterium]